MSFISKFKFQLIFLNLSIRQNSITKTVFLLKSIWGQELLELLE